MKKNKVMSVVLICLILFSIFSGIAFADTENNEEIYEYTFRNQSTYDFMKKTITDIDSEGSIKTDDNVKKINVQASIINKLTKLYLDELDLTNEDLEDIFKHDMKKLILLSIRPENQNSKLTDISPLGELKSLKNLYLNNTGVEDITPLSELTNLKELSLYNNKITDISELSKLKSLKSLLLKGIDIKEIKPLTKLTGLEELRMMDMGLTDVSWLNDFTNLTALSLRDNEITDISSLKKLTNLEKLSLRNNNIKKIDALAKLTKIETLTLAENNITDFSPLDLDKIETLNITAQQISSSILNETKSVNYPELFVEAKEKNNALYTEDEFEFTGCNENSDRTGIILDANVETAKVTIKSGKLKDTEWTITTENTNTYNFTNKSTYDLMKELFNSLGTEEQIITDDTNKTIQVSDSIINKVDKLEFSQKELTDIDLGEIFKYDMTNLSNLNLNDNNITDISVLSNLKELTILNLASNQITEIPDFSNLSKLEILNLTNNKINNISNINKIVNLKTLLLSINNITTIPDLSKLKNIEKINLSKNKIEEVEPLSKLTNLNTLTLVGNQIKDVSKLNTLNNLKELYLAENKISDFSKLNLDKYDKFSAKNQKLEQSVTSTTEEIAYPQIFIDAKKEMDTTKESGFEFSGCKENNDGSGIVLLSNVETATVKIKEGYSKFEGSELTITVAKESGNDDNKTDDNKTDDNKTDDNKTDDNKTDDNKTDANKTDDNKTDDNKIDANKTDANKTDDNKTDANKTDNNKTEGNKTDANKENSDNDKQNSNNNSDDNVKNSSTENNSTSINENKDANMAPSRLPQTGVTQIIIIMLIICAVISGALYMKYRKI